MSVVVTAHAATRYVERIDPALSPQQAEQAILGHSRAIAVAADFACGTVILPNGGRLVLVGDRVVTCLGRGQYVRRLA